MPRYAAIDIGSNSIRMQAADAQPGAPVRILASDREVTRLGSSVFSSGRISEEAMSSVCQVLRKMAAGYAELHVLGVRAVATSAVRDASNQAEFIERASGAVGASVEVISGLEEARLIHLGVQSQWPHSKQRIIIVDVGGGSAEIITAENGDLRDAISKPLGAVRLTEVFLKKDPPSPAELHNLEQFIDEKLEPAIRRIGRVGFDRAIATSATAAALVCAVNRIPRSRREEADRLRAPAPQVRRFYKDLATRDLSHRKKITGIGPRRAEIILPGTAVLLKVLEAFRLPSLYYSAAGVRDGIIADLASRGVGRELSRLTREQLRVVEAMSKKFGVPLRHSRKVASMAHILFDSLQPLHKLPRNYGRLLEAAAYLHDAGHYVSDTGHHKHSAYLVENADLPGFTDSERRMIALLCRYHRKSMPSARHAPYQTLSPDEKHGVLRMTPLLRIADGLDSTHEQKIEQIECRLQNGNVIVNYAGSGDTSLEVWAAERAAHIFGHVYGMPMAFAKGRRTA